MEHTYLLRPGRWRAEGTYYDETGRSFPLAGTEQIGVFHSNYTPSFWQ